MIDEAVDPGPRPEHLVGPPGRPGARGRLAGGRGRQRGCSAVHGAATVSGSQEACSSALHQPPRLPLPLARVQATAAAFPGGQMPNLVSGCRRGKL